MNDDAPITPFEIQKTVVLAKSRALKATWTAERPQVLQSTYGQPSIRHAWGLPVPHGLSLWQRIKRRIRILLGRFTIEDELAEILQSEITDEINRELLSFTKEPRRPTKPLVFDDKEYYTSRG